MVEGELFDEMLDGPLEDEEEGEDEQIQNLFRTTQDHDFVGKIKRSIFKVALGDTYEEVPIIATYNDKIRRFEL